MGFNAKAENGVTIVSLHGRFDTITAPDCDRKFHELLADNLPVVVDLGGVNYVSSAGVRSILVMAERLKEKNGRICLANIQANVRTVFDISGCDQFFPIKDSVEEATAAIS